jgi:hypothetical protein
LIAGLPGESLESFAAGFDRLIALGPQEIQVGILKRLRGTPIVRHDTEWQMVYNPHPPYEILQNKLIDFATMQTLRRFARYWDLVGNSGNFVATTSLIWRAGGKRLVASQTSPGGQGIDEVRPSTKSETLTPLSPFYSFLHSSEWLYTRTGQTGSIALVRLMELLFEYLTGERRLETQQVAEILWRDYQRGGRHDKPGFLKNFLPVDETVIPLHKGKVALPKRQARHLA